MSNELMTSPSSEQNSQALDRLRTLVLVAYGCFALGWFLGGVPVIAGLILLYLKRDDAAGTVYESHFTWLIRTFWMGLLLGVIGAITFVLLVGWFVLVTACIWFLYRLIKGGLALMEQKPILNPTAWF